MNYLSAILMSNGTFQIKRNFIHGDVLHNNSTPFINYQGFNQSSPINTLRRWL